MLRFGLATVLVATFALACGGTDTGAGNGAISGGQTTDNQTTPKVVEKPAEKPAIWNDESCNEEWNVLVNYPSPPPEAVEGNTEKGWFISNDENTHTYGDGVTPFYIFAVANPEKTGCNAISQDGEWIRRPGIPLEPNFIMNGGEQLRYVGLNGKWYNGQAAPMHPR